MICSHCGFPLGENESLCRCCGAYVPRTRQPFCAACGAGVSAGQRFCNTCGQALPQPPVSQQQPVYAPASQAVYQPQQTLPQAPARRYRRHSAAGKKIRVFFICAVLVFVVLVGIIAVFAKIDNPNMGTMEIMKLTWEMLPEFYGAIFNSKLGVAIVIGLAFGLIRQRKPKGRGGDIPLPPVKENETFDDVVHEMKYSMEQHKLLAEHIRKTRPICLVSIMLCAILWCVAPFLAVDISTAGSRPSALKLVIGSVSQIGAFIAIPAFWAAVLSAIGLIICFICIIRDKAEAAYNAAVVTDGILAIAAMLAADRIQTGSIGFGCAGIFTLLLVVIIARRKWKPPVPYI